MSFRVVPLFSADARTLLFEVYDDAGHCVLFEPGEVRDVGAPIGSKVVVDNFDISPHAANFFVRESRRSAHRFARQHGLL